MIEVLRKINYFLQFITEETVKLIFNDFDCPSQQVVMFASY